MSEPFGHADRFTPAGSTPVNLESRTFPTEPPAFDAPPLPLRFSTDPVPTRTEAPEATSAEGAVYVPDEGDTLAAAVPQPPRPRRLPHPRPGHVPRGFNPGLLVALGVLGAVFTAVFAWQLMGL